MLKNYFKTAWRNLVRNKAYATINISGLSVGIAASILLFMAVNYELSYDKFQRNYRNIYRVVTEDKRNDGTDYTPGTPYPVLDALRVDIPQITTGVLFESYDSQVSVINENPTRNSPQKFIEHIGVFFADPQFFSVFHFNWLAGTPAVLSEPNNTVLTKKIAEKYFGTWQKAIGKLIKIDNSFTVKVAGIMQDVPANSDFPLGVVTSYITFKNNDLHGYSSGWHSSNSNQQVYVLLPQNVSADNINSDLIQLSNKYYTNDNKTKRTHFLQPLSEIHFDNRFGNFADNIINKSTLLTLSLIGAFIVIMACINFINLATAQAVSRSKEIGIRKVLGSNRWNLFWQMMGETAIIVSISLILAIALSFICLPFIKHVDAINEPLSIFTPQTILFLCGAAITVTLFSGLYPSLIVSGFSPLLALKNKITSATIGGISLRRGLVITQFAISQTLIIGTIVAISQMSFVRNADLGFNKEAVFVMVSPSSDSAFISRQEVYKQDLLRQAGVKSVSFSSDVPSSDNTWGTTFGFNHQPDENYVLYMKFADVNFAKTFGLQFIAGHNYSQSDTVKDVVINETLVKKLGLKNANDAIGKEIRFGSHSSAWKQIVGVVRDFTTRSLHDETQPLLLSSQKDTYSNVSAKIRSNNIAETKVAIEKIWDKYFPEYATVNFFMDESINSFYQQDERLSLLYKIFAGIAIFISCLGLYGLVSFMAVQRTKEIGIRKVLGASIANIIYLFSKEFTGLIIIAFVIASPVAWYMMNTWLQNFSHRVTISIGVFALAIFTSIVITLITVGYKSIKAAVANPVKSLRTE